MTRVMVEWRLPTFRRLKFFFVGECSISVLRRLMYEKLETQGLVGRVLDFGGGRRANYSSLVGGWGANFQYDAANIDPLADPTFLIGPDSPLPIASDYYDSVITLNTLEHVYSLGYSLSELARVLRPGGRLVVAVPFMFRVHGHPDDYHRGTPSFWEQMLSDHGFDDIRIEALSWGPFSTAQVISGTPGPLKRTRRAIALFLDILYAYRHRASASVLRVPQDDPRVASALGYFIEAKKPLLQRGGLDPNSER